MTKKKHNKIDMDMLREEARVNNACLALAVDHLRRLQKMTESANNVIATLRAVQRDIDVRTEAIMQTNKRHGN